MSRQLRLFPAGPEVRVPELTDTRRRVLARLEAAGCEVVGFDRVHGELAITLRWLIAQGLIEVMAVSPARYRVTKLGRIARMMR